MLNCVAVTRVQEGYCSSTGKTCPDQWQQRMAGETSDGDIYKVDLTRFCEEGGGSNDS